VTPTANEAQLVRRLRQRDDADDWLDAWEAVVTQNGSRVYGLALRMLRNREDAEDATQEVWQRALRGLERFRGESSLATWLFRITMNVCSSRLEAGSRTASGPDSKDDVVVEMPDPAPDPERRTAGREVREAVERALGTLDPAFRSTVILRELEGLSYEEIAEVLDIPVNTVKTRLHRARRELQSALAGFRP
jgi:RNA polymerase sigma-70 factor (ECF subfamily)